MKYISSQSANTSEMGKEFTEARDRIITEIDKIPPNQRFTLLIVLALDAAMLTKYETNSLNTEIEIMFAMGTLWTGPIKKATQIVALDHVAHLEKNSSGD